MSLRSPLSKAVGLGSAKHGFSHWWWQRVTAIALIPLSLWFVYSMICLIHGDHATATSWLNSAVNASIMLLFVLTALFHGQTGVQVVLEDYVHTKWRYLSALLLVKFASIALAVFAIVSVFKVVLGD
jgi:succinate dehydrogenase / fumarate reductase membrane anchor subunit